MKPKAWDGRNVTIMKAAESAPANALPDRSLSQDVPSIPNPALAIPVTGNSREKRREAGDPKSEIPERTFPLRFLLSELKPLLTYDANRKIADSLLADPIIFYPHSLSFSHERTKFISQKQEARFEALRIVAQEAELTGQALEMVRLRNENKEYFLVKELQPRCRKAGDQAWSSLSHNSQDPTSIISGWTHETSGREACDEQGFVQLSAEQPIDSSNGKWDTYYIPRRMRDSFGKTWKAYIEEIGTTGKLHCRIHDSLIIRDTEVAKKTNVPPSQDVSSESEDDRSDDESDVEFILEYPAEKYSWEQRARDLLKNARTSGERRGEKLIEEAVKIAKEHDSLKIQMQAERQLFRISYGDRKRAHAHREMEMAFILNDPEAITLSLIDASIADDVKLRHDDWANASMRNAKKIGNPYFLARAKIQWANLLNSEKAIPVLHEVEQLSEIIPNQRQQDDILHKMYIALSRADGKNREEHGDSAIRVARRMKDNFIMGETWILRSGLCLGAEDSVRAEANAQEALKIANVHNNVLLKGKAYHALLRCWPPRESCNRERAVKYAGDLEKLGREIDDRLFIAFGLFYQAFHEKGEDAKKMMGEVIDKAEEIDHDSLISHVYHHLAEIASTSEEREKHFDKATIHAEKSYDGETLCRILIARSWYTSSKSWADFYIGEALDKSVQFDLKHTQVKCKIEKSRVSRDFEPALHEAQQAFEMAKNFNSKVLEMRCALRLSEVWSVRSVPEAKMYALEVDEEAKKYFFNADGNSEVVKKMSLQASLNPTFLSQVKMNCCRVLASGKEFQEAERFAREGLMIAQKIGNRNMEAKFYLELASLYFEREAQGEALESNREISQSYALKAREISKGCGGHPTFLKASNHLMASNQRPVSEDEWFEILHTCTTILKQVGQEAKARRNYLVVEKDTMRKKKTLKF